MGDEREPVDEHDEREVDAEEASRLLDEIESELEALGRAIARIGDGEPAGHGGPTGSSTPTDGAQDGAPDNGG